MNANTFKMTADDKAKFFLIWVNLLQPFINVRPKELEVLAKLIEYRYDIEVELNTKNEDLIYSNVFSPLGRKTMYTQLGMLELNYNNILHGLRKKGLVTKNSIVPKLLPNIKPGTNKFKLNFEIDVKGF